MQRIPRTGSRIVVSILNRDVRLDARANCDARRIAVTAGVVMYVPQCAMRASLDVFVSQT